MTDRDATPCRASKLVRMMCRANNRPLLAAALLISAGPALALAQSTAQTTSPASPSPCNVVPQPASCGSKADDKKTTTDKFPFPGESSTSPQPGSDAPALTGAPKAAEPAPAPLNPGVPADKKFPFPGDSGAAAKPGGTPGSSSSSSSSSSSADGEPNPDHPELQDKGSEGNQTLPGRHILHRVNPPGTKLQTPDERASEDLDVARFYMDSGDLAAAYSRSQDAVKLFPDDPEAQFMLAEAAAKLNKRDEAIEHYQECLKLDPIEKQAKAARKALTRLQAKR